MCCLGWPLWAASAVESAVAVAGPALGAAVCAVEPDGVSVAEPG